MTAAPRPSYTRFDAEVHVTAVVGVGWDRRLGTVHVEHGGEHLTVVGPVAHLQRGDQAHILGRWLDPSRITAQVCAVTPPLPSGSSAVETYLLSIRHIGPARARALAIRHGESRVFDAIDSDPAAAFAALRGMSAQAAIEAAGSWQGLRGAR